MMAAMEVTTSRHAFPVAAGSKRGSCLASLPPPSCLAAPMHQHRTRQASLPPYSFLAAPLQSHSSNQAPLPRHSFLAAPQLPGTAATSQLFGSPQSASTTSDRRRCHLTAVWQPPLLPQRQLGTTATSQLFGSPHAPAPQLPGTTATSLLFGSTPLLPQRQPGTTAASQLFDSPHAQRVLMAWMTCTSATTLRVPDCSGQTCS
ncbi:hypothetical protein V8C86DRAFT_1623281 [Haematococcus lacustris]